MIIKKFLVSLENRIFIKRKSFLKIIIWQNYGYLKNYLNKDFNDNEGVFVYKNKKEIGILHLLETRITGEYIARSLCEVCFYYFKDKDMNNIENKIKFKIEMENLTRQLVQKYINNEFVTLLHND